MSQRKSKIANRRPVSSNAELLADEAKYGLNDRDERRAARRMGDLVRMCKGGDRELAALQAKGALRLLHDAAGRPARRLRGCGVHPAGDCRAQARGQTATLWLAAKVVDSPRRSCATVCHMAKPKAMVYYLISRRAVNDMPAGAVLDILRYDYARVESNAPDGYYLFSVDADRNGPTIERWKSYGLRVVFVSRDLHAALDYGRQNPAPRDAAPSRDSQVQLISELGVALRDLVTGWPVKELHETPARLIERVREVQRISGTTESDLLPQL